MVYFFHRFKFIDRKENINYLCSYLFLNWIFNYNLFYIFLFDSNYWIVIVQQMSCIHLTSLIYREAKLYLFIIIFILACQCYKIFWYPKFLNHLISSCLILIYTIKIFLFVYNYHKPFIGKVIIQLPFFTIKLTRNIFI